MRKKILIVDDNSKNRKDYVNALKEEFDCIEAESGEEGFLKASQFKPALILTDVCMRKVDGIELCKQLKQTPGLTEIPVIICTSVKTDTADQTIGYISGAVGYLIKPIDPQLLLAKVKAHLSQSQAGAQPESTIVIDEMRIDPERRTVCIGKTRVNLTRKEFDLLFELVSAKGRIKTINYLLETIWEYNTEDYNDPHIVRTQISTLKQKLGERFGGRIHAVTGYGYKYEFD